MTAPSFSHIALLGTVLALAGCGKADAVKRAAPHPLPASPLIAKGEPGQPGGRLVIAASASPKTFNPLFAHRTGRPTASSACCSPRSSTWIGPRRNPAPAWPNRGPSLPIRRRGPSSCARACAGATASR